LGPFFAETHQLQGDLIYFIENVFECFCSFFQKHINSRV